jgi:DNA-binding NarL/FixJ family response regulator
MHPYLSERVLSRSGPLAPLATLAGGHHERLDGSGYHRGAPAAALSRASRLLAAADVFVAMTHARPHRAACTRPEAARAMRNEVKSGRLDGGAVDAVLEVGGATRRARREPRSALSSREIQVVRLLCRGHPNREIAERLRISPKTVGHHVQHIYAKTGVSTRAALAVLALEQGLLQD